MIRRSTQTQMQQFATAAMKMRRVMGCISAVCPAMQCSDRTQQQYGKNRIALVL